MLKHLMSGSSLMAIAAMAPADKPGGSGDISKADKAFLKVIRESYEEEAGHDLKLTDTGILGIVDNVGRDKFMEMDLAEQIALLSKGEGLFKNIAVANPAISGIVSKFDKGFEAELALCLDATIKNKSSAVDIYGQFKRLFTRDQLNEMPYPGSDADDVKGTNYKPDIVETKTPAGEKVRTVFINDLVQAHPLGKKAQADIDDAINEGKIGGSVPRFKDMGKQKLRDLIASQTQVRNGMRSLFRRSLQLHHKLEAISGMPLVQWSWIAGNDDKCPLVPTEYKGAKFQKITRSPKPLWLVPIVDGTPDHVNGQEFSVSQIIAFKPDKALKEGGTLGDLKVSGKPVPPTESEIGESMSIDTMDTTLVALNAKLSNTEQRAALRLRMAQPDQDEFKASVCALYLNLKGTYDANKKWYDEYLNGKQEQVEKVA